MTFLKTLQANSQRLTDKIAIEFRGTDAQLHEDISYGQLETRVQKTMALLQAKGVEKGDRVAIQLPKCMPFLYLHLAAMRLEAISLPLNPGYPARELHYFLEDAETKLFFADEAAREAITPLFAELPALKETLFLDVSTRDGFEALLEGVEPAGSPPTPTNLDATCLMIYTSGTTGRPKGAMLSHGNLTASIEALHTAWGWQEDDVILHVLPIFHVHGLLVALHGALNAGATAHILPRFEAETALQTLQERRCTVFMAVPTIHRRLLAVPDASRYDLSHMRLMTSGSDRLPDHVFEAYQETFGQTLLERYGMSETSMLLSNPLEGERRVGSVGKPLPGVEVRIVDPSSEEILGDDQVGAVQVKGPNVCKGYWRQPEKTAEAFTDDGWLRTGDMGVRAADGYHTLKGRAKDLIITGGYNVYPPEVELVLAAHPDIQTSAVIGCQSDEWGETVTALIILHKGAELSSADVVAHCRASLIGYKVPRVVKFVDEFPRNALGKVQKAKLRETFC